MKDILGLKQPVIGLAPMDGVSDHAFRYITKKYSNPDIIFTEFTNVMGLCIAGQNLLKAFEYDESQRPIIAQIYGKEPEYFYHSAKILCFLGFDGIDINMGCPAKTVTASGSGAGLIRTPDLAREIIAATKEGVKHWVENGELTGLTEKSYKAVLEFRDALIKHLPENTNKNIIGVQNLLGISRNTLTVSVKTRIGYDKPVTEEWIRNLDKAQPAWLTIHGRTLKQLYTGNADWTEIKKGVESTDLAVLANGDIKTYADVERVITQTGAFGALVGRGTFGNPWFFKNIPEESISIEMKMRVLIEHTEKFVEKNPDPKSFFQMRKHLGWYMKGFDGAKEIREKLMRAMSLQDVKEVIKI